MDAAPSRLSPPADPLRRLWSPITIRVAWELVRAGVRIRPGTLRAAREHVLWRIPVGAGLAEAETLASQGVEEYVARLAGRYVRPPPDPDLDILPDPRWRDAILAAGEPLHEAIFRLHYADGAPIEEVQRRVQLSLPIVRAAREALREVGRSVIADDGVSTEGWEPARLDRLLARVATAAADACPGPGGLGTDAGRAHGENCPRCGRALRLMREGALSPSDLFPPEGERCLPAQGADLACILVHPEARRHVRRLHAALPDARRIGEDVLIAPGETVEAALRELAEEGTPSANHVRVVRRVVPGRWTDRVVLGAAPDLLRAEAQGLAWGDTRGMARLPETLPPPPSAARWWTAAGFALVLAGAAGAWAMFPPDARPDLGLVAEASPGRLTFDVSDDAYVDVIGLPSREILFHSDDPYDKGAIATGDGRYRVTAGSSAWIVAASREPLVDTALVAQSATSEADALRRLRARFPNAAIELVR